MKIKPEYYVIGVAAAFIGYKIYSRNTTPAVGAKSEKLEFYKLNNGVIVLAQNDKKYGISPISYQNFTQANQKIITLMAQGYDAFIWSAPGNETVKYIRVEQAKESCVKSMDSDGNPYFVANYYNNGDKEFQKASVKYNDYTGTYQVDIDGVTYDESKNFEEALNTLEKSFDFKQWSRLLKNCDLS